MNIDEFKKSIRIVNDYPRPGILFYDITSILLNSDAFNFCIEQLEKLTVEFNPDTLIGVEARGFIFASILSYKMNIPLVLARKKGKLPGKVYKKKYALEYGQDTLCLHRSDIAEGKNYLVIDDLIATGGTLKAVNDIIEENQKGTVLGYLGIVGLPFLGYNTILAPKKVETIIKYDSE